MCGIAGFYKTIVSSDQVKTLTDNLKHRGPDDQGTYIKGDTGLIHTRLSIIELSELGSQPYQFDDLVLVYNGELYNYDEVREELKKNGYHFVSDSDTEVLIKAFHFWREDCVNKFIGMFAFAIYEERSECLWLFRDRLGVKPLYFSCDMAQSKLVFASELKALTILNRDREIDQSALFFYFRFGFVPSDKSIFKSVKKLKSGHFLKIERDSVEIKKYWNPSDEIDYSKSEKQWLSDVEDVMISSFRYRMVADVPVGVFLSGGIDSSLLSALLTKYHGEINSFTIGFEEKKFDETVYARQVANHLGINHTEKLLKLSEAKKILTDFYNIYDEPFADTSGIPTWCVTQLAKDSGMKVVLSADGGDELFGGYTHYQKAYTLYNRINKLPFTLRKLLAGTSEALLGSTIRNSIVSKNFEHKLYALEELLITSNPTQFFEAFVSNQSLVEVKNLIDNDSGYLSTSTIMTNPIQQMMLWDTHNYLTDDLLVKVDRATMHQSIECREPFLDHRLIELSMSMPVDLKIMDGHGKYIVRQLLKKYVPEELFERRKQGFSIPMFSWFKSELDELFKIYLDRENLRKISCLNIHEVEREYKKYLHFKARGQEYNVEKMWRILSFTLWWDKYMKNES